MIEYFLKKRGVEVLRQPDRRQRCHEMTDEERLEKIKQLDVQFQSYNLDPNDEYRQHRYHGA